MKIKKIGHCCLVIKTGGATLLTDPGAFTNEQNSLLGIDAVLITHEHGDHFHIGNLQEILKNNPSAEVITNSAVGLELNDAGIAHKVVEGRDKTEIKGILIEAYDGKHEEIYKEMWQVQNTGYFIAEKLFYPGDSFFNPERPVDLLALPVAGPWCKLGDAIRYALSVKPKRAFPVHDGMIQPDKLGVAHGAPSKVLPENGIEFFALKSSEEIEI